MRRRLSIAVVLCLALGARSAGLSEKEIAAARKIYIAKCAKCHKLYDPTRYSDSDWQDWMEKMSRKAKLKHDQQELLSRYLDELRHKSGETNARPQEGKAGEKVSR